MCRRGAVAVDAAPSLAAASPLVLGAGGCWLRLAVHADVDV